MSITKPYRRNIRIFTDGEYSEGGRWNYLQHEKYAQSPEHYIRSFLLIQKDLQKLFEFIEPSDVNLETYSYRIHELLLRTCIEVEANCVAIMSENGYRKKDDLNMSDYKKINYTHRLSTYKIKLPIWNGVNNIRQPFKSWEAQEPLSWYQAYNVSKHNRHSEFKQANFDNLLDAVSGLIALISSQFWTFGFSPSDWNYSSGGLKDGMESAIGEYFRIKFPTDWKDSEKYEFNWQDIKDDSDPFQTIDYDKI